MYYAIADGIPASHGKPYHVFKFKTLREIKECPLIDGTSIVYSQLTQLEEFCTVAELEALWVTFNLNAERSPVEKAAFKSKSVGAKLLHNHVLAVATTWNPGDTKMTEVKPTVAPVVKTVDKVVTKTVAPKTNRDAVLVMGTNVFSGRTGTTRANALGITTAVAVGGGTVADAIKAMVDGGFTAAVANSTIKFAIEQQFVALKA